MGVDTVAAADWLANYSSEWVFASDADGRRLAVLEEQGIHAEVAFPGPVLAGGLSPAMYLGGQTSRNLEPVWPAIHGYNRWLADFCAAAPGRRAACIPVDFHDMDRTSRSWPGSGRPGSSVGSCSRPCRSSPASPATPTTTTSRSGAPARISTWWSPPHRGLWYGHRLKQLYDAKHGGFLGLYEVFVFTRRPLWFMIFGGVFDRHPNLKVVVTENGVQWLPSLVRTWNRSSTPRWGAGSLLSQAAPREYFERHVYLGGSLMKRQEAEMRHEVGIERLMWVPTTRTSKGPPRSTG